MENERHVFAWGHRTTRFAALLLLAFVAGYMVRYASQARQEQSIKQQTDQTQDVKKWTCSMHPEIIRDKPGKCPKCGMDLIPLVANSGSQDSNRRLVISEDAAMLMEIQTTLVERKFVTAKVRMVGTIDYDETRLKQITAWVPGRIDRLYVDFTGTTVNKGDHMVYLYSPQLVSAQAELLQVANAVRTLQPEASELVQRSTLATLEAAREKLRLLGLTTEQVEQIERSGQPQTHITITSPITGIVIRKHATEGTYVNTGTPIYTVADLSKLWVKLDAYESDLPWIKYGQQVEFTTEAYPGETFTGTISFIDPVLNAKTRTVKLRVNVDNSEGKLKPNMFVRAVVRSGVAQGGKVMVPGMAGKWICPMHPDVIADQPGKCSICGMDLVTTESLGYVAERESKQAPLVIPTSAALITGTRAVVYVKVPDANEPTFEGREIVLGPRAGDYYLVKQGLAEGELVVTNGNFKIDSAMQIQAKPSMMNPEGGVAPASHHGHSGTSATEQSKPMGMEHTQ